MQKNITFISFLSVIIFLLSTRSLHATVANIIVLQSPTNQYLFLFSDLHRDYQSGIISKRQHGDLIKFAKKLNAHVIIEDSSDYTGPNPEIKKYTEELYNAWKNISSEAVYRESEDIIDMISFYKDFLLLHLVKHCKKEGLSYFNAECRHVNIMGNSKYLNISAPMVAQDFQDTIASINKDLISLKNTHESNERNNLFFNYCFNKLNSISTTFKPLMNYLKSSTKTFYELTDKDFIVSLDGVNYDTFYDSELVDLNILINLWQNQDKKYVFVCAGGFHIANLLPPLQELGYREVALPCSGTYMKKNTLNMKYILDNAPDITQYFDTAYKHLHMCSICNYQCTHTTLATHELHCKRLTHIKYALTAASVLTLGFGVYKYFH